MERAAEDFNLSLHINGPIRDPLRKSLTKPHLTNGYGGGEDDEDLQLSLGLSMNGRFGVDPETKRLKRSSSSFSNMVFTIDNGAASRSNNSQKARGVTASECHAPMRTCSMPIKAGEEEMRQRKELQTMRRMEARKKRMEKLKNVRVLKDSKDNSCEDVGDNGNGLNNEIVSARRNVEIGNVLLLLSSQGSIGSQRSGSSGFSDLHDQSQHAEGASHQNAEVKSPSSVRQLQTEQDASTVRAAAASADRTAVKQDSNELLKNALMDMPYVTTKVGCGLNRVEGFLYRYKKGVEVKIVCVCHGMFLSPAEFVKHGGGAFVENPLKHIVVSNFPLF